MFTGIVKDVGDVVAREASGSNERLVIRTGLDLSAAELGDSFAVNGCCLTAIEFTDEGFAAEVSPETLGLTNLGRLTPGTAVNIEPALTLSQPLGGHVVTGHVDGLGEVLKLDRAAEAWLLEVRVPEELQRYVVRKGSLCVDGVSLTVNLAEGERAGFTIVPHTTTHTVIAQYAEGTPVNLEIDMIARYLERLLEERNKD